MSRIPLLTKENSIKYRKMTDGQMTKEVDKLKKEWDKTLKKSQLAGEKIQKINDKLGKVVSSKKPNNFKGEAFNTKRRPTTMRPNWQKGIDGFNRLAGGYCS